MIERVYIYILYIIFIYESPQSLSQTRHKFGDFSVNLRVAQLGYWSIPRFETLKNGAFRRVTFRWLLIVWWCVWVWFKRSTVVEMVPKKRWVVGGIVHPPSGRKNTTYIPLIVVAFVWGLYNPYHLLGEPETTIEAIHPNTWKSPHVSFLGGEDWCLPKCKS